MRVAIEEMGIGIHSDHIGPSSPTFRPDAWPPRREWPVSIDRDGNVLSRWGDSIWDLTPIAGTTFKLNFGDGAGCQTERLDNENADLLRLMVTWRMWGPRATRAAGTLQRTFTVIRTIVALCSRNGILASNLMRFPKVLDQIPTVSAPSRYDSTVTELHRLFDARDALGFTVVDLAGLKRLACAAPDHDTVQTPYIPPRIWVYQVDRLRECLSDFIAHQEKIETCFRFCFDAYVTNYGSVAAALDKDRDSNWSPFTKRSSGSVGATRYFGPFEETSSHFGLTPLIRKWVRPDSRPITIRHLSTYFSLVVAAGLAYIANFTLQRKEEVAALRADCLIWEDDEVFGRVPIIRGETTKTDPDSDGRWVASPSVESAVVALSVIAELRMAFDAANPLVEPTDEDKNNPYLFSAPSEPWGSGKVTTYLVRCQQNSMAEIIKSYPNLFDADQLRITQEDLTTARHLTPNLPPDKFAVGLSWPLAWHQYRRTVAVNMFASGLISDSSMQQQMKHCSRLMPLYYGRGYTRLRLNENVELAIIRAMYDALAKQFVAVASDRFVSPNSLEHKHSAIVNIISVADTKTLSSWARTGRVTFRENRLGGCMKAGACDYGGIESIARCAGGDSGKPCSEVIFDREKEPRVRTDLTRVTQEMTLIPRESPRYQALLADRRGMEIYLNVICKN